MLRLTLPSIKSAFTTWQLCCARHDHQRGFRSKTYPNSVGVGDKSEELLIDADLYSSATSV